VTGSKVSLAENLRAWIRVRTNDGQVVDVYEGPENFLIEEKQQEGRAELQCAIPAGYTCAVFQLHGKDGLFGFLLETKNADGAVLFLRPNGEHVAWIVECKKTLDQGKWEIVLKQFKWTLARLRAIAGVLGLEIAEVALATAFRNDRLSEDESPNPTSGKAPIGPSADSDGFGEMNWARLTQLAWMNDEIELEGVPGTFRHTKIRLDPNGDGSCQLDAGVRL